MSKFTREHRYVVFKRKDLLEADLSEDELNTLLVIADKLVTCRRNAGKKPLQCLVVESDWPEYEPTWKAIEDRCSQPSPQHQ